MRFLSRALLIVAVAICVFTTCLTGLCVSAWTQDSVGRIIRDYIAPSGALTILLLIVSLMSNRIWQVLSKWEVIVCWILLVVGVALTVGGIALVTD
ncbi:MAG: hypothetical protein ACK5YR_01525 [Pirellula sp.]